MSELGKYELLLEPLSLSLLELLCLGRARADPVRRRRSMLALKKIILRWKIELIWLLEVLNLKMCSDEICWIVDIQFN